MKFFHLSDLHLGLRLHQRDLFEDQKHILSQIISHAETEQPDAVVIAGDVYDKAVPAAEAVQMYDWFIARLHNAAPNAAIMVISGNHDNGTRLSVHSSFLKENNLYISGHLPQDGSESLQRITLVDEHGPVHFFLMPYVRQGALRKYFQSIDDEEQQRSYEEVVTDMLKRESIDEQARNVLVSHQFYLPRGASVDTVERMDSEYHIVGGTDAIHTDLLEPFDYAALGHLHKPMQAGSTNWRYCGTPMAYSRSEIGQSKGLLVVEMKEKGEVSTRTLELKPRRKIRELEGLYEDLLKDTSDDYVYITLTDEHDIDAMDRRAKLRQAYPNMLQLEMKSSKEGGSGAVPVSTKPVEISPLEMCLEFLRDATDEQTELLESIISAVQEKRNAAE